MGSDTVLVLELRWIVGYPAGVVELLAGVEIHYPAPPFGIVSEPLSSEHHNLTLNKGVILML